MTIRFKKYVNITSSVGGTAQVALRELIGRIITTNPLLPVGGIVEFTTLAAVGIYFGTTSEEYKRASQYFAFISKNYYQASKISYAKWTPTATAPYIYGAPLQLSLAQFNLITDGSFHLTLGTTNASITGLNFSTDANLAAVAATLQTAIRAAGSGTLFTAATVTYDNGRQSFDFVGGDDTTDYVLAVAPGTTGTDVSGDIGWYPQDNGSGTGAIWSDGSIGETLTEMLTAMVAVDNNFGSFNFTVAAGLTQDDVEEVATWNAAQNNMFMYLPVCSIANASAYSDALSTSAAGTGLTIDPAITGEYPEQIPMEVLATTNYLARNSTQNYMYQQDGNITPSVTDDADSDLLDSIEVNYYGETQNAGQNISFYQTGVLFGPATSPSTMNVYANEIWLKDAMGVAILNGFLGLGKISANEQGLNTLLNLSQPVINQALLNGMISVAKNLNALQIAEITRITGSDTAWQQVQNGGYWINWQINTRVNGAGNTEYYASYILIYSKDDVINYVQGQDILI